MRLRKRAKGDMVEVSFETEIEVIKVDDSDASGKYPLAIKYGALLFSYYIPEKWIPIPGNPMTPLPEGWSWYDVYPDFQQAEAKDGHERLGLNRHKFTWNIALDENLKPSDFEIEELPENEFPWDSEPYGCTNPRITYFPKAKLD